MGQGTSSDFWTPGNDGVRITVVDASSGTAVSSPLDFSNRTQKTSLLHFGKVNKLQYLSGTGLSLQSGAAYSCIKPAQSMPTIVSSKGQSNIEAIKRYFCSEYACMMVAQAARVDYERMIAGEYKLLIEPIAYFTHNGQYYCMTATEAGLYDQMSGGNLRKTMTSLTHKNLPLSMFLEFSDLGISAWTGNTTGKQNNSDIISTLGVGIVWFDEAPPEGEIEAPDVEYRVDTDVITAVTLRTDQDLTPDNPASVTFHILGTTYRVNDIVIPAGDSQVVWVKWHTPSTPQTVTITVSVSGAYTAQDTFVAKIVDLNEHIPPDPVATDTNPGYSVPPLPSETQKLTANWGVWSCYWVPVWVWCDHGEDGGHWVDEGYWEYEYTGYSASISGEMSLMPDDIVPTASGKTMKSGYGVKTEVRATLSTDAPTSHIIDALFRSQRKSATLSDELNVLLGTPAKGFFNQDYELKQILKGTGRADRYEAIKRLSLILFAVGAVLALLIGNVYMVPILGIGFSLIPIWYLRSTATSYKKHLNEELETAISIITTSYLRTEDLIRSVKENLPYINEPVKANFEAFVYEAELINANITSAINSLKMKIPNRVFHEWCGTLIQCQSDRSMKNTLPTINQKFSDVRVVQSELEAMMQGPRREAITMIFLVIANVPLLYFLNEDWFHTLIFTTPGKIALAICAAIILFSLTQIMKLSKPIEYGGDSV